MSSQTLGSQVDIGAVNGVSGDDAGVSHGARLLAFTEAVMGSDEAALERERRTLRDLLDPASYVDAAAVIGAFNVVDRIADSTGIPLDDTIRTLSAEVRQELDLARFGSSANTPGA